MEARDQRCIISHRTAEEGGLQACHIIPRCHSSRVRDPLQSDPPNTCSLQWVRDQLYAHLAPVAVPNLWEGYCRIDSAQNGILLGVQCHYMWDTWRVSINPVDPLPHYFC